jgi:hypothetical protein
MRTAATDWGRRPGEPPEVWLARLRATFADGLAPYQKRRLNSFRGHAQRLVKEACRDREPQAGVEPGGAQPRAADMLSRCKEAIRAMSVPDRQQLLLWWLNGMAT